MKEKLYAGLAGCNKRIDMRTTCGIGVASDSHRARRCGRFYFLASSNIQKDSDCVLGRLQQRLYLYAAHRKRYCLGDFRKVYDKRISLFDIIVLAERRNVKVLFIVECRDIF